MEDRIGMDQICSWRYIISVRSGIYWYGRFRKKGMYDYYGIKTKMDGYKDGTHLSHPHPSFES